MDDVRAEIHSLAALLEARSPAPGAYVAERLTSRPWARVARSTEGVALALPGVPGSVQPDLVYAHLSVRFNVDCVLESAGETTTERLVLVECRSDETAVKEAFFDVAAVVLPSSADAAGSQVQEAVLALADLFVALLAPSHKTTLGLWGELFAMARAADPGALARAWHVTPRDRYDFAADAVRLEVKTTTGIRSHYFSLEQLSPPAPVRVFVASMITTESPAGPSIEELLARIAALVDGDVRSHLLATAMRSLGSSWSTGRGARFDDDLAWSTFEWFAHDAIPCVADPPVEVSEVKFRSDLRGVQAMSDAELAAVGGLLGSGRAGS